MPTHPAAKPFAWAQILCVPLGQSLDQNLHLLPLQKNDLGGIHDQVHIPYRGQRAGWGIPAGPRWRRCPAAPKSAAIAPSRHWRVGGRAPRGSWRLLPWAGDRVRQIGWPVPLASVGCSRTGAAGWPRPDRPSGRDTLGVVVVVVVVGSAGVAGIGGIAPPSPLARYRGLR